MFRFQSGPGRVQLLELYTSEGCSSCPPAESWFSNFKKDPALWKQIVPISFHVDYWDHIGWKDPLASRRFSERQRAYAASWNKDTVYTPGFVLNGKEWKGWFSQQRPATTSPQAPGLLSIESTDGTTWTLQFKPDPAESRSSFYLHAVSLGFDQSIDVKAGENKGRRLSHDFVVLETVTQPAVRKAEAYESVLRFKPRPSGATSQTSAVIDAV